MMEGFDWKAVVGTVAPAIATALGGPLAGTAVAALSKALLGRPDGSEEEVAAAIATGGTDALAAIRAADQAFKTEMTKLGIDLERIHAADRDSARQREVKAGDTATPRALAFLVTVGFFGVLAYLLHAGKPPSGGDALLVMLGALGGAWASIVAYYFGSSSGSAEKNVLLARR